MYTCRGKSYHEKLFIKQFHSIVQSGFNYVVAQHARLKGIDKLPCLSRFYPFLICQQTIKIMILNQRETANIYTRRRLLLQTKYIYNKCSLLFSMDQSLQKKFIDLLKFVILTYLFSLLQILAYCNYSYQLLRVALVILARVYVTKYIAKSRRSDKSSSQFVNVGYFLHLKNC